MARTRSNMKIGIKLRDEIDSQDAKYEDSLSSPDLTPSQPFKIVMITQPGSSQSVDKHVVEEEAEFHTPPEHHSHSHLSSSEDQNPSELCAEALMILAQTGDEVGRAAKARVSEAAPDEEPGAKRVRVVAGEEFDGESVPLGETQVAETEKDVGCVRNIEDIVLDEGDSDAKEGNSDSSGSLQTERIEEEIAKLKRIFANRSNNVKLGSGVAEDEEFVEISKDAERPKNSHRDEGEKVVEISVDSKRAKDSHRDEVEKVVGILKNAKWPKDSHKDEGEKVVEILKDSKRAKDSHRDEVENVVGILKNAKRPKDSLVDEGEKVVKISKDAKRAKDSHKDVVVEILKDSKRAKDSREDEGKKVVEIPKDSKRAKDSRSDEGKKVVKITKDAKRTIDSNRDEGGKAVEISKDANSAKDSHRDEGKKVVEISKDSKRATDYRKDEGEKVIEISKDSKRAKDSNEGKKVVEITKDAKRPKDSRKDEGEKVLEIPKDAKRPKISHRDEGQKVDEISKDSKRPKDSHKDGEKVDEISKDSKKPKDSNRDEDAEVLDILKDLLRANEIEGVKINSKKVAEIEDFRYEGDANEIREGKKKAQQPHRTSQTGRKLPPSIEKKKEKTMTGTSKKGGLFDLLDTLKVIFGDVGGGSEDVDFLETAKKKGMNFPKPRWWPSEDKK